MARSIRPVSPLYCSIPPCSANLPPPNHNLSPPLHHNHHHPPHHPPSLALLGVHSLSPFSSFPCLSLLPPGPPPNYVFDNKQPARPAGTSLLPSLPRGMVPRRAWPRLSPLRWRLCRNRTYPRLSLSHPVTQAFVARTLGLALLTPEVTPPRSRTPTTLAIPPATTFPKISVSTRMTTPAPLQASYASTAPISSSQAPNTAPAPASSSSEPTWLLARPVGTVSMAIRMI